MITPLMLILSSLNEKQTTDSPVSVLYLNRSDRDLILSEATRLCNRVLDENIICTLDGQVYPTQSCSDGEFLTLDDYTVAMLERIIMCARVYLRSDATVDDNEADYDLGTQDTVLKLEGNPSFIYYYVYSLMYAPTPNYEAKLQKLAELLQVLQSHTMNLSDQPSDDEVRRLSRLELHSHMEYWKTMLVGDVMRRTKALPQEQFTEQTIETIQKQLKILGFYGFVNPLQMYKDFGSSRVSSKTNVEVEEWVLAFLGKIIQSGGGRVQLEDNH